MWLPDINININVSININTNFSINILFTNNIYYSIKDRSRVTRQALQCKIIALYSSRALTHPPLWSAFREFDLVGAKKQAFGVQKHCVWVKIFTFA